MATRIKYFQNDAAKTAAMAKVAKEYGRGKNGPQLAEEMSLPLSIIMAWVANMRSIGIEIPKTYKRGNYVDLIEHLKQTMPSIITKGADEYLLSKKG